MLTLQHRCTGGLAVLRTCSFFSQALSTECVNIHSTNLKVLWQGSKKIPRRKFICTSSSLCQHEFCTEFVCVHSANFRWFQPDSTKIPREKSGCFATSLCQQMFSREGMHTHSSNPGVLSFGSTKTPGESPRILRRNTSFISLCVVPRSTGKSEQCYQFGIYTQLLSRICRNRNLSHVWSNLRECKQIWLSGASKLSPARNLPTLDRRMHHHFSGTPLHCPVRCFEARSDTQSSFHVLCRVQPYGSNAGKETDDPLSPDSPQFRCYMEHLRKEHQSISDTLQGRDPSSDSKQKELRESIMELRAVLDKWQELTSTEEEIADLEKLIKGSSQDKEMVELATAEKDELEEKISELSDELIELLLPSEETDDNDVIVEFSAGVGGQEAMLFAGDMFDMYQRYAAYRGWTFNVLEYFSSDIGGLRHASVSISGEQAYRFLRLEAGVHRVQRVPKTESKGRVHTSTMAIAVLPQPNEIDLKLDPKDLRVETKKASGAGGQHVNTTDSAVRITHLPTGISAESQQERSQHKNRAIAMTMLETRIYNRILEEQTSTERSLRRSQVGSAGRSEKIRTYNYQQDRVTDHRVGRNVHGVPEYLLGTELLDDMVISSVEYDERREVRERILEVYDKSLKS